MSKRNSVTRVCRYVVVGMVSLLAFTNTHAQQEVSVSEIIALADTVYSNELGSSNLDRLVRSAADKVSHVEKIEFRSETDRWDAERQEYTVRMSFKSQKEKALEQRILASMIDEVAIDQLDYRADQLIDMVERLISIHSGEQEIALFEQLKVVAADKKKVLTSELQESARPDILDMLELEDDILDIDFKISELKKQIASDVRVVVPDGKTDWKLDFEDWIAVDALSRKILELGDAVPNSIAVLQAGIQLKERKLALQKEKAEGGRVLDFVQLKHAARNDLTFGNEISLGVGLVLPSGHVNRTNILESQIELAKEEWEHEILVAEQERERKEAIISFQNEYDIYLDLKNRITNQDLSGKLERLQQTAVDPLVLLNVKEMILKRQRELINMQTSIYESYLEVLEAYGVFISSSPNQYFTNN